MAVCSTTLRMPLSGKRFSRSCSGSSWLLLVMLTALLMVGCGPAPDTGDAESASPAGETTGSESQDATAAGPTAGEQTAAPPAQPGRLQDLSFDDVKFEMDQGAPFTKSLLPEAITTLDGGRIRIRGYILPRFQQEGITQFVLVRDNMECCFGPGAALYDCIVVRMLPGRSTNFSVRPVAVSGIFHIEELIGPDGRHLAIYSLNGEDVE